MLKNTSNAGQYSMGHAMHQWPQEKCRMDFPIGQSGLLRKSKGENMEQKHNNKNLAEQSITRSIDW